MENKMMAMRVALRDVSRVAEEMTRGTITKEPVDRKTVDAWAMRLCEIISRDLAIPLRNCDVGTAEEQGERCLAQFDQWRRKGDNRKLITAIMEWAQMPCGAKEGGAK